MFVETKKDGEAPAFNRDDFIAWLRTKEPTQEYDFWNCAGECAVGQYMAAKRIPWSINAYADAISDLDLWGAGAALCEGEQTFGALTQRMLALRAAA